MNWERNDTSNSTAFPVDAWEDMEPRLGSFLLGLTLVTLCLVGALGNLASVWIFGQKSMRSPINTLLLGLSLIDLALLGLAVPVIALPLLHESGLVTLAHFPQLLYVSVRWLYPVLLTAQTCSVWTFVLLSVERYLAVCRPLHSQHHLTNGRVGAWLAAISLAATAFNLCRFWDYRPEEGWLLAENLRASHAYRVVYLCLLYLASHFLVPFSLLILLSGRMLSVLLRRSAAAAALCGDAEQSRRRAQRRHSTSLMILVVTLIFLLSNTLPFVLNIWEAVDAELFSSPSTAALAYLTMDLSNLLVVANSAVNFGVYLLFCKRYRHRFFKLVCMGRYTSAEERRSEWRSELREGRWKGRETATSIRLGRLIGRLASDDLQGHSSSFDSHSASKPFIDHRHPQVAHRNPRASGSSVLPQNHSMPAIHNNPLPLL